MLSSSSVVKAQAEHLLGFDVHTVLPESIVELLLLHSLNAAAPPSYDEASKKEGRVGQTTNVAIGGTVTDDSTDEWLSLDQKVKSYPTERGFTAIGTGGDDFVEAMVVAVESVLQQPIPELPTRNTVILNIVPNAARASAYKFGISLLGQNSDPTLSGKRNTDFVSSVVKFEKAKKGTIGDSQKSTIIQATPVYVESEQGTVKKNRDQLEQK